MIRILFLLSLSLSAFSTHAITITQTAANVLFDLTPVTPTDAGDYFNDSYTRDSTLLTINGISNTTRWRVYAKLSVFIHSGSQKIRVQLKRQGNGTGVNIPLGGNSFRNLNTTTFTQIFRGQGNRFNIPMRTRIRGIGVGDDFGTFDTTIEYKVETY